jgi:hypothetical protein
MKRDELVDYLTPRSHSFGLPLLVTVLTIGWEVGAPEATWSRTITVALFSAALGLSLNAAETVPRRRRIAALLILISLAMMLYGNSVKNAESFRGVGQLLIALPVLTAAYKVIQWIGRQPIINGQSVLGGVLVYMLAGLTFAQLYGAIIDLSASNEFFCGMQDAAVSQSDRVYFSFSTITTTGFGDFVSCTRLGHAVSMSEAIFGQVYLVTIIALLVGNMGRRRNIGKGEDQPVDETA